MTGGYDSSPSDSLAVTDLLQLCTFYILLGPQVHLLDSAYSSNSTEYSRSSYLPAKTSTHSLYMTGDPVDGDVQSRGHCFL